MNTFNAGTIGTTQNFRSAKVAQSIQPSKMTIIRNDYVEPEPIKSGYASNTYSKPIPLAEGRVKRLTIKMSDEEYTWLTNFFDLIGDRFDSIDDMIRQMLLQPEMRYKFLEFLSFSGNNDAIDHCINNQPSGFGWK